MPTPAPKSKSEEDMSDPPSANDPGKSSAKKRIASLGDPKSEDAMQETSEPEGK